MPAQRFRHRLDLARRHPLHVHLRQRPNQSLLRPLVALEQLGREPTRTILRNSQLQRPNPRHQRPTVIAAAVRQPARRALPFRRTDRLRHLRLERLLHQRLNRLAQELPVPRQQLFQIDNFPLTPSLGHGVLPFNGVGDLQHHQHAMTTPQGFC